MPSTLEPLTIVAGLKNVIANPWSRQKITKITKKMFTLVVGHKTEPKMLINIFLSLTIVGGLL